MEKDKTNKKDYKSKDEELTPKYWKLKIEDILKQFYQTTNGYTNQQYQEFSKKFEKNEFPEEEKESITQKISEQFQDTLVRILLAAALISFILALTNNSHNCISAYIEPFVILLILIANAIIGVWQDINSDKAIDALKKLQPSNCNVKRNGKINIINSTYLIPV